jgi:molybdate transport system substrate-binding protein
VLGSVKAGVAVRQGDWEPDISTAQRLKEELIACDAIAYTEGSSGIFAEELIQRLGIREVTKEKTTRLADASGVMKFLAGDVNQRTIGFGQLTAILLHAGNGVKLVGPLPKEVENITTYAAGIATGSEAPEVAHQFLRFLVSPFARAALRSIGVEPAPAARTQE